MAMEPVSFAPSGNIQGIYYDSAAQSLYILFHSKRVYRYPDVTGEEAQGFAQTLSANDYLQRSIIPQHAGEKVGDEEATKLFG